MSNDNVTFFRNRSGIAGKIFLLAIVDEDDVVFTVYLLGGTKAFMLAFT